MNKGYGVFRGIWTFAAYVAVAAFLIWRAETFIDMHGANDLLARLMCLALAILLLMTGLMRAVGSNDPV